MWQILEDMWSGVRESLDLALRIVWGPEGHGTTTGVTLGHDAVVMQPFPRPGQADKKE